MRLLAVDDDDIHLSLLSLMLEEMGYRDAAFVGSAVEALRVVRNRPARFDCFLLDIDMPEMTGIELCRKIRATPGYGEVPVLMLTGLSEREHMDAAFEAGATDFLVKPVDEFELSARLRLAEELLRDRRRIVSMTAEIEAVHSDRSPEDLWDLSTRFTLDDVGGSVEYLAFENFIFRASSQTRNMHLFAVKVANAVDLFAKVSSDDFQYVMNCVGDSIAEILKRRSFFLTYAGSGIFPIALRDGLSLDIEAFALDLFSISTDIEVIAKTGVVQPELCIGAPVKSAFFPRQANLNALAHAIANAEEAARAWDLAGSDGADGSRQYPGTLFGLLKVS